jgi:hypothetical protein
MKKSTFSYLCFFAMVIVGLAFLGLLVTCGGGGGGGSSTGAGGGTATGTVNTSISDPPTCKATLDHVWVTITRVRAHTSSSAGANDGGWIELVDLRSAPRQIDLLNLDSTTCILTQLGSTSGILAGQYQQIRLILLSNSPAKGEATPSSNQCGSGTYNCVVPVGGTPETLLLSSEAQTGMKIPSGQIAGGKFTVPAGGSVDLNIDFDACSSIIRQGNGQYRLKPVLHAAEVSVSNTAINAISGRVVTIDSGTKLPIPIANAVVLVEERDPDNQDIDRVLVQKKAGPDGRFTFCYLAAGTYDIVASATNSTTTYNATVTLSVPTGTDMGDIPLVPEGNGIQPAEITGQITTSTGSAATTADISLSALQAVAANNSLIVTIPLFDGSTPNVATATGGTCPNGTDCVSYTLFVPASNPQVGTFRATPPTSYTAPASGDVHYWVNARAFIPGSDPVTKDCSPSSLPTKFDSTTQITVSAGATVTHDVSFTGCQ